MKKIVAFIAAAMLGITAFAQQAEEILSKMEQVMSGNDADGLIMTFEMKIPILGTISSKTKALGDKMSMEVSSMGKVAYSWHDSAAGTSWTYDPEKNTITIENYSPSDSSKESGDAEMFTGVAEGYGVSIKKETDKAWYIACKKLKTNTNKDDPKNMEIVVAKGSYMPLSLSAKTKGITITIKDLAYGVKESDVTFDASKYPGATIVDKRESAAE